MMTKAVSVDGLDLVVVLVVGALTFTDFLIGAKGRQALKERVGYWWIYVADTSFAGFVSKDAERLQRYLQRVFGRRWWSWRCFGISFLIAVILGYPCGAIAFYLLFGEEPIWDIFKQSLDLFFLFVAPAAVMSIWLSFGISNFIFGKMSQSVSWARLAGFIALDLLGILLLLAMSLLLVQIPILPFVVMKIEDAISG